MDRRKGANLLSLAVSLILVLSLIPSAGVVSSEQALAPKPDDTTFAVDVVSLKPEAATDAHIPSEVTANRIFHAESDYTLSPYWGRTSYPNYDLGFTVELTYPYPYAELVGNPVPGDYVTACEHDTTNHLVRCTGTFPKGTPGGTAARFTYEIIGTCELFTKQPSQVAINGTLQWSDGGTATLTEVFNVAQVKRMTMIGSEPRDGAKDVPIINANGQAPLLEWSTYDTLACNIFPIPDSFDTSYWVSLRRKGGSWQTIGGFGNCDRKIQLQPTDLPCSSNGEPVTWEWRVLAYDYKYGRCRTQNPVETKFTFTAGSCRPEVKVLPKLGNAYFLSNVTAENPYRIEVDWTGSAFAAPAQPPYGNVHFILNGNETVVGGQSWGAEQTYDMGKDFNASWNGGNNTLEIYADYDPGTGQKIESEHITVQPMVFPYPEWVGTFNAGPFSADVGAGEITYENELSYPREPFSANIAVPKWIPYLGGKQVGILETQAGADIAASSKGTGKVGVKGQTGLGLGIDIIGAVNGKGNFAFIKGDGLKLVKSSFGLSIAAKFEKTMTLGDLVPGLRAAESWWLVGGFIKKLNNLAQITGMLVPRIAITAFFEQSGRDAWVFTGSIGRGEIGATIRGDLKLLEKLYAWAEGGGTPYIEMNFPPAPGYFRELGIDLMVNAGFRAWSYEKEYQRAITCSLPQAGCREKEDDDMGLAGLIGDDGWTLVPRDYINEGYNTFVGDRPAMHRTKSTSTTVETPIVAGVYSLSEPSLAVRVDDHRTLLYLHDDPTKPLGQGMELMATQWTGTAWSPPTRLTNDRRLDFAPQIAYDGAGNAVAVWERSYTDAITTGLTLEFIHSLDIATATWISATNTWSPISMLSHDNGMGDYAPRLRTGADGAIMALWETNEGFDLMGTADHPVTYTHALWDGANWSTPAVALSGLYNTLGMDMALYSATEGALVVVRDSNLVSTTVGTDLYYSLYDGAGWSALHPITSDPPSALTSDTSPALVYDADGTLKLIWLRGTDMVMLDGSWNMADVEVVRPNSEEAGFLDPLVARSPQGHVALAWQSGHGGLFDLAYMVYDATADRWSADQVLTQDDALEISASPAFGTDGTLHVAYRKQHTTYVTETVVFSPTLTVTYTNVPRSGASDLYVLSHNVGRDLAISDLMITPLYPAPGELVTLTAHVQNVGDLVTGPIAVRFDDDGVPIATVPVAADLIGGTSVTVTTSWTTPAVITTSHTIAAVVDPTGAIVETDETNNTTTLDALTPRLVAEWTDVQVGSGLTTTLGLVNLGSSPAHAPIPVFLKIDSPLDGDILAMSIITTDVAVGTHIMAPVFLADLTELPVGTTTGWLIAGDPDPTYDNAWPVEIQLLPDVTPQSVAVSGIGNLELLDTGPITITVRNAGTITATGVILSARAQGSAGTLVHSIALPAIGPESTVNAVFTYTPGTGSALWIELDPDDAIDESDETNNIMIAQVPIKTIADDYIILLPLILRGD